MQTLKFELTQEDVNFNLSILDELPTKTGAWMLTTKLRQQIAAQQPQPAQPPAAPNAPEVNKTDDAPAG